MKNKLLLTTAISSLAIAGFANAETKITGDMTMSYMARSDTVKSTSADSWGKESQLNIANSGDLNNGMKYAAGFSLEFDGGPSTAANANSISNENFYIDFISGGTTISLSQDHGLHTDSNAVPRVGVPYNSVGTGVSYRNGAKLGNGNIDVKESPGVFVAQSFSGGTLQVRKVRELVNTASNGDNSILHTDEGGAYDVILVGDLGVKGLSVNLQYAKADKASASTYTPSRDSTASLLSAAYTMGKVTVGAARNKRELGTNASTDLTTTEYGVAFAASDNLSIGINYAQTDNNNASTSDEKIKSIQLGYNLGAVAIALGYQQVENVASSASTDADTAWVRVSTKF